MKSGRGGRTRKAGGRRYGGAVDSSARRCCRIPVAAEFPFGAGGGVRHESNGVVDRAGPGTRPAPEERSMNRLHLVCAWVALAAAVAIGQPPPARQAKPIQLELGRKLHKSLVKEDPVKPGTGRYTLFSF